MIKMIDITEHAYIRMKERMGLSRHAAKKTAETAFELGIKFFETRGRLKKYLLGETRTYQKIGTRVIIYGEMVYIFSDFRKMETGEEYAVLVTVWYIPNNLKNSALGLQRRKKERMAAG